MKKNSKKEYLNRDEVNEMIESALRRHNRRSTIISSVLGWILIGGYSFGLFQAEDGIRDRSPSRGLGDVYKRQILL